jgi:hypothetical protein
LFTTDTTDLNHHGAITFVNPQDLIVYSVSEQLLCVASQFMEDMEKRSNCKSFQPFGRYETNHGTVTASELERLKKRFMKLDR